MTYIRESSSISLLHERDFDSIYEKYLAQCERIYCSYYSIGSAIRHLIIYLKEKKKVWHLIYKIYCIEDLVWGAEIRLCCKALLKFIISMKLE